MTENNTHTAPPPGAKRKLKRRRQEMKKKKQRGQHPYSMTITLNEMEHQALCELLANTNARNESHIIRNALMVFYEMVKNSPPPPAKKDEEQVIQEMQQTEEEAEDFSAGIDA
jgi:hypothetical protein